VPGNILHLEGDMSETHFALLTRCNLVFAVVIKQLQAGAAGQGKIGDVKLTTIHGLQLRQPQDARIEIDGFTEVGYVNGNMINLIDLQ